MLVATDYADACPIETVALEVASSNEPLRIATAEVFESWIVSATTRFRAAGLADETARELSIVFISLLEGAFILCRGVAHDRSPRGRGTDRRDRRRGRARDVSLA